MKHVFVILIALAAAGCDTSQRSASSERAAPVAMAVPAPAADPADAAWNTADADGVTNGNMEIAVAKYLRGDELPEGTGEIAAVFKKPWEFYGQRMCFQAETVQVEDLPPGAEMAAAMGGAGEIVAMTDTGEIIDMIVVGGTGNIQTGQRLNMCGLVVGRSEVENRVGGTFRHLIMVGKLKPDA